MKKPSFISHLYTHFLGCIYPSIHPSIHPCECSDVIFQGATMRSISDACSKKNPCCSTTAFFPSFFSHFFVSIFISFSFFSFRFVLFILFYFYLLLIYFLSFLFFLFIFFFFAMSSIACQTAVFCMRDCHHDRRQYYEP